MKLRARVLFLSLIALIGSGGTDLRASDTATLTVTVAGLTPLQGQVFVSLFDNKKDYLKTALVIAQEAVGDADSVDVIISDLPPGTYAVSVFYDLDNDGEMATGMFRIPKEPVGFSNNARGKFGPAKWKKTKFQLADNLTITVNVVNAID